MYFYFSRIIRWLLQGMGESLTKSRNSSWLMFFKIGVLEDFAISTEKHLYWSLFLIKLQLFYRTPPVTTFVSSGYYVKTKLHA